jgi:hypothetical protein
MKDERCTNLKHQPLTFHSLTNILRDLFNQTNSENTIFIIVYFNPCHVKLIYNTCFISRELGEIFSNRWKIQGANNNQHQCESALDIELMTIMLVTIMTLTGLERVWRVMRAAESRYQAVPETR